MEDLPFLCGFYAAFPNQSAWLMGRPKGGFSGRLGPNEPTDLLLSRRQETGGRFGDTIFIMSFGLNLNQRTRDGYF